MKMQHYTCCIHLGVKQIDNIKRFIYYCIFIPHVDNQRISIQRDKNAIILNYNAASQLQYNTSYFFNSHNNRNINV